ncbi:MAG: hypothetical protein A2X94_13730 [Bdellovibrionales bacterium GWB1_55_8]|nr:MAG: hypothetical protein A2X94_13730 [Bdellovibrionales bacterium GWB1_55_8]
MQRKSTLPRTWIVCPNLWGARLFYYGGPDQTIEDRDRVRFLKEFARPKVKTKLEDFRDDDDAADISEPVEDPALELQVAQSFMKYLARELDEAKRTGRYDALILCAEKHLLQIFQEQLQQKAAGKAVIGTIPLDLYEVNETDLTPYVKDILQPVGTREYGSKAAG